MNHAAVLGLVGVPLCVLAICARRLATRATMRRPQRTLEHDLRTMLRRAEDEPMERERIG